MLRCPPRNINAADIMVDRALPKICHRSIYTRMYCTCIFLDDSATLTDLKKRTSSETNYSNQTD
jgi:hypothetical protein